MLVVGAGVVGMACARSLQRGGYRVCVADPAPPGSLCSHGNAGIISSDHVLPLARPDVLRRVPAMLLNRSAPLYLTAARVPGLLPWMLRFAAACRAEQVGRGTRAIAALTGSAMAAWEDELEASGGRDLLKQQGMYTVYRSVETFQRDGGERERQRDLGVDWEVLNAGELRSRERALSADLQRAVYYPGVAHVLSPRGVVTCLADAFSRAGGTLLTSEATGFACQPHQVVVQLAASRVRARYAVLAAGLGSARLCQKLGIKVPMAAEMGYHVTFSGAEQLLGAPLAVAEDGFVVTPMDGHLRAAGTVEFASRELPPNWGRARMLARQTARLFGPRLPEPTDCWRGSRPTLPDFLPAIGALPGHPRVLAAFGHQHIGLTTAAVTGALVRDLVRGDAPALDITPYDPGRFTSPG